MLSKLFWKISVAAFIGLGILLTGCAKDEPSSEEVNAVIADNANQAMRKKRALDENGETGTPAYLQLMDVIESQLEA